MYVPDCEHKRRGISRFCKAHQHNHQDFGHPTLRLPVGDERRAMLAEGERMLAWFAKQHGGPERVQAWLSATARSITAPASMAIPPRKIEKQMTQRARAGIILAWYLHKRRLDPKEIVKLYLAAELYTWRKDLHFGPAIRNGFTNRLVGHLVAKQAKIEQEREVYRSRLERLPSWANQEYRRIEEIVKVKDKYKPQTSVYKMLGKLIREWLSKDGWLMLVKDYYDAHG